MSNRSLLINSPQCTSDPRELERARAVDGVSYLEIAEAANRVPLPWLLCFGREDLRPVNTRFRTGPSEYLELQLSIPVSTVSAAQARLQASLPLLEEIAGDALIAHAYWQAALTGLAQLPFAYLTIDPLEVLAMNDLTAQARDFVHCFDEAHEDRRLLLKRFANFEDGFLPYSLEDLYHKAPEELEHEARAGNAAALDAGIGSAAHWRWLRPEATPVQGPRPGTPKPWWKFWQ